MRSTLLRPWIDPRERARLLLIAVVVSILVTAAHRIVTGAGTRFWLIFHAMLPSVVYTLGAWTAGARRLTLAGMSRGVAVVGIVLVAFGWINSLELAVPAALALNFVVPLTVSTLGAAFAGQAVG